MTVVARPRPRNPDDRRERYTFCFSPPFCRPWDLGPMTCVTMAIYNVYSTYECEVYKAVRMGDKDTARRAWTFINRLNHIIAFLALSYLQKVYQYPVEIDCALLECWRREFACWGYDIRCVYRCFDLCGYCMDCTDCHDYVSPRYIQYTQSFARRPANG